MALAAAGLALAGCGGQQRRAEPRLTRHDAGRLVSLARKVALDAPSRGCAAKRDIAALSASADALVASGRVPPRLRAPLLAGVAAVAADAPACTPPQTAPAATPVATPVPPTTKGGGPDEHGDRGRGRAHGKGQKDGNEGD